mgnify:CR=1 FL=1
MPRESRKNNKIITNTYHIIARGINKQDIFLDSDDKDYFYGMLKMTKAKYKFDLYAYTLMNNHINLAICDKNDKMSKIMHRICAIYAMYFNRKYERVGHVFQNRFKNVCVDTESYLLNLIRYIHKNPEKDGICNMNLYKWSSYHDYISYNTDKITDTDFILQLFDRKHAEAVEKFIIFHKQNGIDFCDRNLEFDIVLSDEEAAEIIRRKLKLDNLLLIQNYSTTHRNKIIYSISQIAGIYPKQMSRILGMSERNIQRIIKNLKDSNNIC